MTNIHSTAVIADTVESWGAMSASAPIAVWTAMLCWATIAAYTHVVVTGNTTVGADTRIFPFASIGHISQDLKYDGEDVSLEIGAKTPFVNM